MLRVRPWQFLLLTLLCFVFTGCVARAQSGDKSLYTTEPWLPVTLAAVGVISFATGVVVVLRSSGVGKKIWSGLLLMLVVPAIAAFITLTVSYQSLAVSDGEFNLRIGFPWAPIDHDVPFDALTALEFRQYETRRRGGTQINYEMLCYWKRGGNSVVPLGDLMKAALDDILGRAQLHGVAIHRLELRPPPR
jgi:hypothetical protein